MKILTVLLLCLSLLCSCEPKHFTLNEQKQYTATFIDVFDTVTTVVGRAESEAEFKEATTPVYEKLLYYHKLFDIYNEYDGINNLKTLNDRAAISPVEVESHIIELLSDCKKYYSETNGAFNPAMGSVLSLWHDAREDGINDPANAYLPDEQALISASLHTDPNSIIIDRERSTVFFSDADLKLDVGAIAKGWAVQRVCESTERGMLISVGGNVSATGEKDDKGNPWAVGIRDFDGSDNYLHILNIHRGCVVTSGSYMRRYEVDGKLYHHIIDPSTLYPGERWVSVSVVCEDSGLADVLSTALFLLDRESGQELLDKFGAHAMWVDADAEKYYSPEFQKLIRN